MPANKRLPVGIENFEEMRTMDYYYIDKTGLICDLLDNLGKVNLFTRPRRFGKTLNMSMLKCFFEPGADRALFEGLEVSKNRELCDRYMGQFPVISVSLKGTEGENFQDAKGMLRSIIAKEALRFSNLMSGEALSESERRQYRALVHVSTEGIFTMADELLRDSLLLLSQLLQKVCGRRVIILIDEYDVPLHQAYQSGYYDEMVRLIRLLLSQALKSNDSLHFAVLTGCLRISKESIFTGFNNFNVDTIRETPYQEHFGFTDREVRALLEDYGWSEKYDAVRAWYDGYRFGDQEIYCPWDVICYCHALRMNPSAKPQNYWVNTSSNDIIRSFVGRAGAAARSEIERLIDGGSVRKKLRQELTYRDLDSGVENLWSLLFTTGYLTRCSGGREEEEETELAIPNREIRWIFEEQICEWFREETVRDTKKLESFCTAFERNDVSAIEAGFQAYLKKTISIRNAGAGKGKKENFYHGILLGLLGHMDGWEIRSNAESGEGYCDIIVEIPEREIGFVVELKYAENAAFDAACQRALRQIREKGYEEALALDGIRTIYRYGIACYRKRCRVISG